MTPVDIPADPPRSPSIAARPSSHLLDSIRHRPLATYAVGFAAGIWIASTISALALVPAIVALTIFCVLFIRKGGHQWVAILALVGMAISGGAIRYAISRSISPMDISRFASAAGEHGRVSTMTGEIASDPQLLPGRVTFALNVRSIESAVDRMRPAAGQTYVTVSSAALRNENALEYGDIVSLHGSLETPKPRTNPGAFSWRDYLNRRGIYCTLAVKRPGAVGVIGRGGDNPLLAAGWRIRRLMVRTIDAHLPSTEASVLEGILIGQRTQLPSDLMADFVRTGTIHIIASAGLHVGILIGCLWLLFNRLTLHRKVTAGSLIGILIVYVIICGERPSVTRAAIMAIVYLGALLFEREPDLPTALGVAALWILVDTPYALLEPGFQLSFATVITLVAVMPVWDGFFRPRIDRVKFPQKGRRLLLWFVDLAGLTLFAQLGSAPIVAAAYNETSLIGAVANLLVVPALFLVIPIGLLAVDFGSVPILGPFLFKLEMPLLSFIEAVVRHFGEASGGFSAMSTPPAWLIVVYYGIIGVVTWTLRKKMQKSGTQMVTTEFRD